MSWTTRAVAMLACFAPLMTVAGAGAQEGSGGADSAAGEIAATPVARLPVAQSRRPMTLTAGAVRADATFDFEEFHGGTFMSAMGTTELDVKPRVGLALGAGYGVFDPLEAGLTLIDFAFSRAQGSGLVFLGITPYARLRLASGGVAELGVEIAYRLGLEADAAFFAGAPLRFYFGDGARVDTGFFLSAVFEDTGTNTTPRLPVSLLASLSDAVFAGIGAALFIPDVGDAGFEELSVGTRVFGGYTLPGAAGGPLLDLTLYFGFPELLVPGSDGDSVRPGSWLAGVTAAAYFDTPR